MLIAIAAASAACLPVEPQRTERLVALAHLDAAVHYFNPGAPTMTVDQQGSKYARFPLAPVNMGFAPDK